MSAALDHEAREVLSIACYWLSPVFISGDVVERSVEAVERDGDVYRFRMTYEADLWAGNQPMLWTVTTTRTRVVRVEVSRG